PLATPDTVVALPDSGQDPSTHIQSTACAKIHTGSPISKESGATPLVGCQLSILCALRCGRSETCHATRDTLTLLWQPHDRPPAIPDATIFPADRQLNFA